MSFARVRTALLCAMAIGVVLVLAACGKAPDTQKSEEQAADKTAPTVMEGLKQEGTLTVGIPSSATAPFLVKAAESDSGLDVDLACALASQMGLKVEFVLVNDVSKALSEKCDIVMGVSSSEAKGFDVFGDYAESVLALFHKGEVGAVAVEDINGKSVALQDGSSAQMALRITSLDITEVPLATLNEAFDKLDADEADFVLCNSTSGAYLSSWRDGIGFAGALSDPTVIGIAVASGDGSVQQGVRAAYEELAGNGTLAEIRRTWLGDMPTLTSEHVIANIPMKETEGESLADIGSTAEVLNTAMDGSTAGANAVSPAEAAAMGAVTDSSDAATTTSVATSTTATQDYYGYEGYTGAQSYDYSQTTTYDTTGGGYEDYAGGGTAAQTDTSASYDYSAETSAGSGGGTDYGGGGDYTESYE